MAIPEYTLMSETITNIGSSVLATNATLTPEPALADVAESRQPVTNMRMSPGIAYAAAIGCAAAFDAIPFASMDLVAGTRDECATQGHICGWDNGKPSRKIQPRNAKCVCGSGKKAKHCCVYFPQ